MPLLRLYSVYHLNLAFSSIEVSERGNVIKRAYWPLLALARKPYAKIAIEANGYTLEEINRIDPAFIVELKELVASSKVEFIGSGYAQVIGPLVPAEVTMRNLLIGNEVYAALLGQHPTVAYVDEQTFSMGLVPLYAEAGYDGMIMEWNNAARYQKEWDGEWRYRVVLGQGTNGQTLPILWNDSISFQRFQRYAHAEATLEEHQAFLESHKGEGRVMALYGNDAEIFDFRPGRYRTEAALDELHEWDRIDALYRVLAEDTDIEQAFPSALINDAHGAGSMPTVSLVTPEQPIVVKKQEKYNLSRWALTGRDSITINTACYRIYDALMRKGERADPSLWKDLCYAWDSDFRTHITADRFAVYRAFLHDLAERAGAVAPDFEHAVPAGTTPRPFAIENNRFTIETPKVIVRFNVRRGLALEELIFPEVSDLPLVGTVPHGYFDHIPFNADFYAGNTVIDVPAVTRITDLEPAEGVEVLDGAEGVVHVIGRVCMENGIVTKHITIDGTDGSVTLAYAFDLRQGTPARFHTGLLTFNPEAFDRKSLFYACHNGGRERERFSLAASASIECNPVSLHVSCSTILGNTTGCLLVGDAHKHLRIETDLAELATLPFVAFTDTGPTYFLRSAFSLAEFDDTTRLREGAELPDFRFRMTLRAARTV